MASDDSTTLRIPQDIVLFALQSARARLGDDDTQRLLLDELIARLVPHAHDGVDAPVPRDAA